VSQEETPYLDALIAYSRRNPGRLHIPGHKGGPGADPELLEAVGEAALRHDIAAGIVGVDIPPPDPTPFQRAQALAAAAWGARRSWFLLNGASEGNHASCLALAHAGERVVVQRNVHSSTIDGLIMGGLRPRFAAPEIDPELGIAHCLTPESLDEALAAEPEAVGAIAVSPTYFGAVADIAALAEVAHGRSVPLVVDEAWGAHLHFSQRLPGGAIDCGADLVVSSTHKIVGSMTQSAILHLGESADRLDESVVDRCVTLVESTSPNALLTASLDAARRHAALHGTELLGETIDTLERTREEVRAIPGLDVLDERIGERPGVYAWDPLRLSIDVRGTGAGGQHIAELMHDVDDINLELFTENVIVAVFGMGERAADTAPRLLEALRHAVEKVEAEPPPEKRPFAHPPPWGPLEMTPREAFLGKQDVIPFEQAEGRVAAESLAAYPPGVPNVLPGELLTAPTLAYIADSVAHGGNVRGAADRTLHTVRVVAE
jgi:lysine decarboxylase